MQPANLPQVPAGHSDADTKINPAGLTCADRRVPPRFSLDLPYDYRCYDGNGSLGSARLTVFGSYQPERAALVLTGHGPSLILPGPEMWTMEVQPALPMVTLRLRGYARDVWADPVFTMGPRGPQ